MYPTQESTWATLVALNRIIQPFVIGNSSKFGCVLQRSFDLRYEHERISRMNTPNKGVYWSDLAVQIDRLILELGRLAEELNRTPDLKRFYLSQNKKF